MHRVPTLIAALLLLISTTAHAEDAVLVKDVNINPRALGIFGRCTLGTKELIIADDGIRGIELWEGDGLQGSTRLVKDINPGYLSGIHSEDCAELGGVLYFPADDGIHGFELWRTDGTAAGTYLVKDINPGPSSGTPNYIKAVGNVLLFAADDGVRGMELWRSDGTEGGTELLVEFEPGAAYAYLTQFVVLNGNTLIFRADTTAYGAEIWKSDGTASGTSIIKDIVPGAGNSNPYDFTSLGSKVFFGATTPAAGFEPWVTDGTLAGTQMLADIYPGVTSGLSVPTSRLVSVGGKVLFEARDASHGYEPWVSDGTPSGTMLLKDINSGGAHSFPSDFAVVNGKFAFDADSSATGREPWVTDGTSIGTHLLADLIAGPAAGMTYGEMVPLRDGRALIFKGYNKSGSGSTKVFSTDGTDVTLLTDLFPGAADISVSVGQTPTSAGVPFALPAPVSSLPPAGSLLTQAGTVNTTSVHPGGLAGYTESSAVVPMGEVNGKLVFTANDVTHGYELWVSDGTPDGTSRLTDINFGVQSSVIPQAGFAVVGNTLLFVATTDDYGAELWRTDGTEAGTQMVQDINPGSASAFSASTSPRRFYRSGPKVYFAATTAAQGTELWVYDSTTATAQILADIKSGTGDGLNESFSGAGSTSGSTDLFYFAADDGTHGTELWLTDGTTAPGHTVMWADISTGATSSRPSKFSAVPGGGVVFEAWTSVTGSEPFASIGLYTGMIKDINPGAVDSDPEQFVFLPSPPYTLFFKADTTANGQELWKSDFTDAGTTLVKDIVPGSVGSLVDRLAVLNSTTILFRACGSSGDNCELWKSDGTAAGTVIVKDLIPGSDSGYPDAIGVLNGVGYFLGRDPSTPYSARFYRSDGTETGTYALTDEGLQYTSLSLLPQPFTPALSTLFFGSFSRAYGYELFKIGDDQCPSDDAKTGPGLCGCGVRDDDADGDGAVDCLEGCPGDPLKQVAGVCGCGVADVDANSNAVYDCIETEVSVSTPPAPRLKSRKRKVTVLMTERAGVTYEVMYRVQKTGKKLKPSAQFKSKTSSAGSLTLTAPRPGRTLYVKYRYLLTGTDVKSPESPVRKKKVR